MADIIDVIQIITVGGITILASLLTTWVNNKSAERRMLKELTFQRRNDALNKLFEVANKDYKSFDDLERELLSCMHGSLQSLYLPEKVVKGIYRRYALSEREKRKISEVDRIAVLKNVIKNLISDYIRDMEK